MIILGITGGIATGKSTVTRMFADLGAPTASADDIARELLLPGTPQTAQVAEAFPSTASSTEPITIDRRALSSTIFGDETARKRLEAILHPPIIAELSRRIAEFRSSEGEVGEGVAAIEIPLLFESGLTSMVDKVVVVAVDEETQLARLQQRLGIDRAAAEQQLAAQWPLAKKVAAADYVIDSGAPLDDVRERVRQVWKLAVQSGR